MSNNNGESDVTPTESKTTGTVGHVSHGSRETPATSVSSMEADRSEKARGHKSDRHVAGESDSPIVPQKPANNDSGPLSAESVEGRGLTKENVEQWLLDRTQRRASRSADCWACEPRHVSDVRGGRHHPREEPYAVVPHVRICAGGGQQ